MNLLAVPGVLDLLDAKRLATDFVHMRAFGLRMLCLQLDVLIRIRQDTVLGWTPFPKKLNFSVSDPASALVRYATAKC